MLPAFSVPTPQQRKRALGALAGSPFSLRKSLQNTDSYPPINLPSPNDWLSDQYQAGQSFDQFKVYANIPQPPKNTIYIQPYDQFLSKQLLTYLQRYCKSFFPGCKFQTRKRIRIQNLGVDQRDQGFGIQYNASQILNGQYKYAPLNRFALIGITSYDIYNCQEWNYVFGLANPINKTGVFSFARYDPQFYGEEADQQKLLSRAIKVMTHEIGHMFGLLHCIYYQCLMNGSNHIYQTDSKPFYLCPVCLRKLYLCLEFNPVQRFESVGKQLEELGFQEEAEWYFMRVRQINQNTSSIGKGRNK